MDLLKNDITKYGGVIIRECKNRVSRVKFVVVEINCFGAINNNVGSARIRPCICTVKLAVDYEEIGVVDQGTAEAETSITDLDLVRARDKIGYHVLAAKLERYVGRDCNAIAWGAEEEEVTAIITRQYVNASAAFEYIVAVATIQNVVPKTTRQRVIPNTAEERIGAVAPTQHVVAAVTNERIISRPASKRVSRRSALKY